MLGDAALPGVTGVPGGDVFAGAWLFWLASTLGEAPTPGGVVELGCVPAWAKAPPVHREMPTARA